MLHKKGFSLLLLWVGDKMAALFRKAMQSGIFQDVA
jgi:hypothetical protein